MKKAIALLVLALVLSGAAISAQSRIGLLGGYPSSLTFSAGDLEIQLGTRFLGLYASVDYKFFKQDFAIEKNEGFFWNVGIGPYVDFGFGWLELGAVVPFEFGYNIPEFLDGKLDIYAQAAPGIRILSTIGFAWNAGVGIRYKL